MRLVEPLDFQKKYNKYLHHLFGRTILVSGKPKQSSIMKRRISRVLNFFAFNLLFFALYLNFVHRDNSTQSFPVSRSTVAANKGTVLVSNPDQYLNKTHKDVHVNESQN